MRHGLFNGTRDPGREYWIWVGMRQRCLNQRNWAFPLYGGRGIKICDRWINDPIAFLSDMGPCPDGYSIDRVDNDGNYEPENCRWASRETQTRNRGVTIRIDGMTIPEISKILGMSYSGVYGRLKSEWGASEILSTRKITDGRRSTNRMLTAFGKTQTLTEWANESGLSKSTISARIRLGWTERDAVTLPKSRAKGERCGPSKLNERAVQEIRLSKETNVSIAKRYGVSGSLISMIRKGKAWSHVNDASQHFDSEQAAQDAAEELLTFD